MSLLSLLYTEKWTRAHTEPQRQVQTAAGVMRRRMQVRPQPGRHLSILASAYCTGQGGHEAAAAQVSQGAPVRPFPTWIFNNPRPPRQIPAQPCSWPRVTCGARESLGGDARGPPVPGSGCSPHCQPQELLSECRSITEQCDPG